MILCLETATPVCSVALCNRDGIISVRESREKKSHATQLTVFIKELLEDAGIRPHELEAIAVSKGPGSFTGLRIGISVSKGLAFGGSVPLIGIDTTVSMFNGIIGLADRKYGTDSTSLYCPMIDARRMEVYYSLFDHKGNTVKGVSAQIIDKESFTDIPESVKIVFFGDGAEKCLDITGHKNSVFAGDFVISASFIHKPAYMAFDSEHFEDVAYFEPFYLKDFIATVQRKNIVA